MSSISNSNNSGITTSTHAKPGSIPGHKSSSSSSSSSTHTAANSACAACKYQRRKCKPDCTLAPYFPANKQQSFLNAHRLFGVSNIMRIIADLDPLQRNEAMQTIIYQSDMRAHDPVGGCYFYIQQLEHQIKHDSAELAMVLRQLAICRQQAAAAATASTHAVPTVPSPDLDSNPGNLLLNPAGEEAQNLGIYGGCNGIFPTLNGAAAMVHQQEQQQHFFNYFYENVPNNGSINNNMTRVSSSNNNNILGLQQQLQQPHPPCMAEDVKPLVDMFEVRALIGVDDEGDSMNNINNPDVAYLHHQSTNNLEVSKDEGDDEGSHHEGVQQRREHELKGAASLFTLTNCGGS